MTRHPLSKRLRQVAPAALLLAATALAAPSTSLAQSGDGDGDGDGDNSSGDGNIVPRIIAIDGDSQDTLGDIFINLEHCQDNVEIDLEIDSIPGMRRNLDIYVGTGTNCTTIEARDGDNEADCRRLEDPVEINDRVQDVPVTLRVKDIVRAAFGNTDCEERSSTPTLWFLAVNSSGGTEAVTADQYGTLEIEIDTQPPDPPTSVEGGRGENEIPVSWSVGSNKVDSFEIYVDSGNGMAPMRDGSVEPAPDEEDGGSEAEPTGETNDMCGTGALRAGDSSENVTSLLKKSEGSPTATETTLSSSVIDGDVAAVAVVAIDAAGNRSALSEVACVFVVPTRGIKDLYEEKYGEIPQGCPCAAAGPAQIEGALPIGLALAFIAFRRRRRS